MLKNFDQLPVLGLLIELTDDGKYHAMSVNYDRYRRIWMARYVRALSVTHPGEHPEEQEETAVVTLMTHSPKKTLEQANAILERLQEHPLCSNCDIERLWVKRGLSVGEHSLVPLVEIEPGLYCNSYALEDELHLPPHERDPIEGKPLAWFRSRSRKQSRDLMHRRLRRKKKKTADVVTQNEPEQQGDV